MIKLSTSKFNLKQLTKKFVSFIFIISFVIIIDSYGVCQIVNINTPENAQQKGELNEDSGVKIVPFTQGITAKNSTKKENSQTKLSMTVEGLKEAGYSLSEITTILKNDKKDAQSISIACLKQGYNASQIHSALLKAGFSKSVVNKTVPESLVKGNQFLTDISIKNNADDPELQSNSELSGSADVLEVPVSVGVTFNGLGNWEQFQDKRFK